MRKFAFALIVLLGVSVSACSCPAAKQAAKEVENSNNLIAPKFEAYVDADPKLKPEEKADWKKLSESNKRNIKALNEALKDQDMPNIDYGKLFEDLKDSVVGTIKEEAKAFLDKHQDAKDFVEERGKRLAELGIEYVKAADDGARQQVLLQMKVVQQSIRNEISSVAVTAEAQARASFAKVVDTAVGVFVKAIPALVSLIQDEDVFEHLDDQSAIRCAVADILIAVSHGQCSESTVKEIRGILEKAVAAAHGEKVEGMKA